MLSELDCVTCRGHILFDSLFENNFADFLDEVWVKIIKIFGVDGVSLQQHLLSGESTTKQQMSVTHDVCNVYT